MAKTTRKRSTKRASSGKPRRKNVPPKNARNGVTIGNTKEAAANRDFAKNQPVIPGMDDVDERVSELDEICERVLADRAKRASLSEEMAENLQKIGELLGEHNLNCYIVKGMKFVPEPGEPTVKIYKVKQQ